MFHWFILSLLYFFSRPIKLIDFPDHVQKMAKDSDFKFSEEFEVKTSIKFFPFCYSCLLPLSRKQGPWGLDNNPHLRVTLRITLTKHGARRQIPWSKEIRQVIWQESVIHKTFASLVHPRIWNTLVENSRQSPRRCQWTETRTGLPTSCRMTRVVSNYCQQTTKRDPTISMQTTCRWDTCTGFRCFLKTSEHLGSFFFKCQTQKL